MKNAGSIEDQELMEKTFAVIRACQLAVIDLTEKGAGLGVEAALGYESL